MTIFGADPGLSAEQVTLSRLEFDVLWRHLGLKSMPVALHVASPGTTIAERDRLVQAAWDSLHAKGLGRAVDLDPRLHRMLTVLERPDTEVDGRFWLDREIRVLAAMRAGDAVLATLTDQALTLREAAPTGLPREALTTLPAAPAGPGASVTMPAARFDAAARAATTPEGFEAALAGQGLRGDDARRLRGMIGDVTAQGQFGGAARDRWGARHRADHVVSFFDTPDGRYVQIRRASAGGEPWVTIAPADVRRIHQHVTSMYDDITAAHHR